jgi:hypothetical protein
MPDSLSHGRALRYKQDIVIKPLKIETLHIFFDRRLDSILSSFSQDRKLCLRHMHHNYMRSHEGLDGKTPAEACGIKIVGENKW